ncbi:MAG: DUF2786 domain-containing protein [Streptosporangiaceae bacterium]|nr:DUF2786 domain-containing protein [Streptosporangiaceae bacterium]
MHTEPSTALLDRVRKLLAKAEDEGVTPHEAEALTAKAAELMARYGIDRARLAATQPHTDKPDNRVIDIDNPWATVKAHLLTGLATALRCQCVLLARRIPGSRVHVFGYASDLERADILYTSLLVQMARGLAAAIIPATAHNPRAWRRSWMLGYSAAVVARVKAAEQAAAEHADDGRPSSGPSTALVLADRALTVRLQCEQAYPNTRRTRITYSGNGYHAGYREGEKADIGGPRIRPRSAPALAR